MYQKIRENKFIWNGIIILSFLILSFISVAILFHSNTLFRTADIQFHFRRVIELNESIKHGKFFPDFSFNQFHGSAVMLLYPYLSMLPMVFLSFIIKSRIIVFYAFFIFNNFLTLIIAFYSSRSYVKKNSTGYVFAIIYSFSTALLSHGFLSVDFGIVFSFTFIPLVMFGFVNVLKRNNGWLKLSLGMALIAFSHVLNTFIIAIFLLLWLLINFKRLDEHIILNLLKSLILFLLITSIIWLPMLNFYLNKNSILTPEIMQLRRIDILTFLSGLYGKKTPETLGFFPIIAIFLFPFFYKKVNYVVKQMYILSMLIVIIVLFFPWQLTSQGFLQILNHFQFTFRLLIIPNVLLNFTFAFIITNYIKSKKYKIILHFLVIFISIFLQVVGQYSIVKSHSNALSINHYLNVNNKYTNLNYLPDYMVKNSSQFNKMLNAYSTADDDYIPQRSIPISKYVNSNIGFYNYNDQIKVNHIGYNKFSFSGNKNMYRLSLPIYMYNNEKLHVYMHGREMNYFSNKDGLLTIDNIENNITNNNNIYIKSAPNIFKIISTVLSTFGMLISLILIIKMFL